MKRLAVSIILIFVLSLQASAYEDFAILDVDEKPITLEEATEYMLLESDGAKKAKFNLQRADSTISSIESDIEAMEMASGFMIKGYDSANKIILEIREKYGKKQREYNYEAEINLLKYELRRKYFTVLQLRDVCDIRKEAHDISASHLKELEKKFSLGLINELELMQGRIQEESAELAVVEAKKNLTLATMDLNNYLGYDINTNLKPTDKLEQIKLSEKSLADTKKLALENNNNIRLVNFAYMIQERIYKGLSYRYAKSSNKYKDAVASYKEAKNNIEKTQKGIEMDVSAKYMTMLINNYKVELARRELDYAKRQKEAAELSYKLGLGVYLDVKRANANIEAKNLELSSRILEYNLSVDAYELMSTVGTNTVPIN